MPDLLVQLRNTDFHRRVRIRRDSVIFGRGEGVDLALRHPSVSRRHFAIRRLAGAWYVEDLGSKAGTWVNRVRVEGRRALEEDDIIAAGEVRVTISGIIADQTRAQTRSKTRRITLPAAAAADSDEQPAATPPRPAHETILGLGDLNYDESALEEIDAFSDVVSEEEMVETAAVSRPPTAGDDLELFTELIEDTGEYPELGSSSPASDRE